MVTACIPGSFHASQARPATIVIFIGYYAIAVLVVVNLVTACWAKLDIDDLR